LEALCPEEVDVWALSVVFTVLEDLPDFSSFGTEDARLYQALEAAMSHLQIYKTTNTNLRTRLSGRHRGRAPVLSRLPTPKMGVRPRLSSRLRLPSLDCGVREFRQGSTATRPVEGKIPCHRAYRRSLKDGESSIPRSTRSLVKEHKCKHSLHNLP
jgi:hypothetical protein